jgi:diguanylate cyclase (GGDEF)-like protein/PAS domain S-box-containing protein
MFQIDSSQWQRQMDTRTGPARRLPTLLAGWAWLAFLRLGLAIILAIYALTYIPQAGHPTPGYVTPSVLGIAGVLAALAVLQLVPANRARRSVAIIGFVADAAAVLGTLLLYSFDPRQYLPALLVVVQAEGGVVLGIGGGILAWAVTSAGYLWIGYISRMQTGAPAHAVEDTVRIGVGLLLALGGGFLADELSGERQRRLAVREQEVRRLQENEARYRTIVEEIPVVTYVDAVDRTSSTIYISPRVQDMLGYTPEAWMSDPDLWPKLLHPDDRDWVMAENARTNASWEPFKIEYRLIARDGRVVWVRDEAVLIRDEQGRPEAWQGVMVDITERKRAEEEITFLAYHDELTGLPNRLTFERALDLALARGRRRNLVVSVLFVDLDDFKRVNDTLGHAAGDELLRQVTERLTAAVRETDVVARHAGDEFLILLADLDPDPPDGALDPLGQATLVAERIHESLEQPFVLAAGTTSVSASIGVSRFPLDADNSKDLLNRADAAMYQSKKRASAGTAVYGGEGLDPRAPEGR